jgi:hypothetical protein
MRQDGSCRLSLPGDSPIRNKTSVQPWSYSWLTSYRSARCPQVSPVVVQATEWNLLEPSPSSPHKGHLASELSGGACFVPDFGKLWLLLALTYEGFKEAEVSSFTCPWSRVAGIHIHPNLLYDRYWKPHKSIFFSYLTLHISHSCAYMKIKKNDSYK